LKFSFIACSQGHRSSHRLHEAFCCLGIHTGLSSGALGV
jgi:hypothetical protein